MRKSIRNDNLIFHFHDTIEMMTEQKKIQIGNSVLYLGDAFDILPKLGDASIDALISDPPYASKSFGGKCTACDWDKPIPLDRFWQLVECKCKQSANIVLFGNMKFGCELLQIKKDWFRYDLVYAKPRTCGWLNSRLQPLRSHENLYVFGRPGYQKSACYNPQKVQSNRRPAGYREIHRHKGGVYGHEGIYIHTSDGTSNPRSVLPIFPDDRGNNQSGQNFHPTQKGTQAMVWLIETYSNPGDVILDSFMGSGSTGVAAVQTGRKFIGIEKSESYFTTAVDRIQAAHDTKCAALF